MPHRLPDTPRLRHNDGVSRPHLPPLPSPYVELTREDWARLHDSRPIDLTSDDVRRLSGLGERIDLAEVEDVYLPLSRLVNFYAGATKSLHRITSDFLDERPAKTPFIIGVAGSVAVGKSTTARVLRELLARWPDTPRVELLTTDGFLFPNAELERRGIMDRKGFPESYDRRALVRFVAEVKGGKAEVEAPVYSHLVYDIVPDEKVVVRQPDILIVEGLNVLQPPIPTPGQPSRSTLTVSDFFDFSVFVDARESDIRQWYVDRFLRLRSTAFADPDSYFHRYAELSDEAAVDRATAIWESINLPNLLANVQPSKHRATAILRKGADHHVESVKLRKL